MLKVGLTGGIGSGKSEVSRRLAARGALLVDADVLARDAVAPGSDGLATVVTAFGSGVLDADGSLDRAALGRIVFGDPEARRRLEAIVHPRVRALAEAAFAAAPYDAIVVHDVPLLVEAGLHRDYDVVLVVAADPEVQLRRLVESRGMSAEDAAARIAAQAPLADKLAVADLVIWNNGDLGLLGAEVDRVWRALLTRRDRAVG